MQRGPSLVLNARDFEVYNSFDRPNVVIIISDDNEEENNDENNSEENYLAGHGSIVFGCHGALLVVVLVWIVFLLRLFTS